MLVDVLDIPAELESAAAAALGEVLQGAVVDRPDDGARIAEALRAAGEGRVSLVPVEGRVHADATRTLREQPRAPRNGGAQDLAWAGQ